MNLKRLSDPILLQESKIQYTLFNDNKQAFTTFDATLNDNFSDEWHHTIKNTERHPNHNTVVAVQKQFTDAVNTCEKACIKTVNDVRYYIEKAFPGDDDATAEFGLHHLEYARKSTARLIIWMKVFHRRIEKYAEQLAAAGMPAGVAQAVAAAAQNLENAEIEQEEYKLERFSIARLRNKLYDSIARFAAAIARAADVIFADAPEKRKMFAVNSYKK